MIFALFVVGCAAPPVETFTQPETLPVDRTAERPVITLPLAPPLNERRAELSGLDWYGDWLVLLPQYPELYGSALFALHRDDILAYLDTYRSSESIQPLVPRPIALDIAGILIPGYEGYEAIAFDGDRVYLAIEAHPEQQMITRVMTGSMVPDADGAPSTIRLDAAAFSTNVRFDSPTALRNMSDEALVVANGQVYGIYEANGGNINPAPRAHVFSPVSGALTTVDFPTVEFRITDATRIDADGCFWAVNYFWPGERTRLNPATDLLATTASSAQLASERSVSNAVGPVEPVERLVKFCVGEGSIALANTAPIGFRRLPGNVARNWEGVARLDGRGFLLVTDQYPRTLLGFVEAFEE